jgi:hypothetical protein
LRRRSRRVFSKAAGCPVRFIGLDHKRLTFLHNGRDERLTDVGGHVLKQLLA